MSALLRCINKRSTQHLQAVSMAVDESCAIFPQRRGNSSLNKIDTRQMSGRYQEHVRTRGCARPRGIHAAIKLTSRGYQASIEMIHRSFIFAFQGADASRVRYTLDVAHPPQHESRMSSRKGLNVRSNPPLASRAHTLASAIKLIACWWARIGHYLAQRPPVHGGGRPSVTRLTDDGGT